VARRRRRKKLRWARALRWPAFALLLVGALAVAGVVAPRVRPWPFLGSGLDLDLGPPVHAGIDLRDYPGDGPMRKLRERAPYEWTGYYLESPNHPGDSWSGTWPRLRAMGWGVAILYVGQQKSELTTVQGAADAVDAAAKARAEGFPTGAAIFLDIEHVDEVSPELLAYARAFTARLQRIAYRPAIYCHVANAERLRGAVGAGVPFWVSGGSDFDVTHAPAASGVPWAEAWQGWLDTREPWGVTSLNVDVSVAGSSSPSLP